MRDESTSYEIGYLIKATLKDEEVLAFSDNIKHVITDNKGLILSEGRAKKQALAYPINKETTAFFNWIKFSLSSSAIKELKSILDRHQSVLRFLLIKNAKEEPAKRSVLGLRKPKVVKQKTTDETPKEPRPEAEIQLQEAEIDKKIEEILGE
ncbi:30S ribosomal protein S6 [Patescibacteria group bacterium]